MVSYVNNKFNIMGDKRKREEEELKEDDTLSSGTELLTQLIVWKHILLIYMNLNSKQKFTSLKIIYQKV